MIAALVIWYIGFSYTYSYLKTTNQEEFTLGQVLMILFRWPLLLGAIHSPSIKRKDAEDGI